MILTIDIVNRFDYTIIVMYDDGVAIGSFKVQSNTDITEVIDALTKQRDRLKIWATPLP